MVPPDTHSDITLDAALRALANPVRRQVVTTLLTMDGQRAESCAGFDVGVSKSTLTQHMRVLSDAGIVETVDHGNRVFVALRSGEIDRRLPGLLDLLRQADAAGPRRS